VHLSGSYNNGLDARMFKLRIDPFFFSATVRGLSAPIMRSAGCKLPAMEITIIVSRDCSNMPQCSFSCGPLRRTAVRAMTPTMVS